MPGAKDCLPWGLGFLGTLCVSCITLVDAPHLLALIMALVLLARRARTPLVLPLSRRPRSVSDRRPGHQQPVSQPSFGADTSATSPHFEKPATSLLFTGGHLLMSIPGRQMYLNCVTSPTSPPSSGGTSFTCCIASIAGISPTLALLCVTSPTSQPSCGGTSFTCCLASVLEISSAFAARTYGCFSRELVMSMALDSCSKSGLPHPHSETKRRLQRWCHRLLRLHLNMRIAARRELSQLLEF